MTLLIFASSYNLRQRVKKIHRPSVNRFDGVIFWYGLVHYRTKEGMIKQKYNMIDGVN